MEQQELRDWESRCIQEEPPYCQAACPIHVDARAFMEQMKAGNADAARRILEKTMPLPSVLGAICDHPCEAVCKRGEAGEPLAIGALERACLRLGRPGPKPLVLPSKGKKAAVLSSGLGSGLAALTCAWDLIRKGYGVTVFTPDQRVGGRLCDLPESLLPAADLAREVARLEAMGVVLRTRQEYTPEFLESAQADFDAVFAEYGAPLCPESRGDVDPVTLQADSEAVFCGGWPGPDGTFSPIGEATDARRAAASMDRHMSGASLTASREKEGPIPTRLYTSLKGVEPSARVVPGGMPAGVESPSEASPAHDAKPAPEAPPGVYSAAEAAAEAARCLNCQCLECVKVCAYLEHYKGYPKKYARQIYNNAAIVQGVHQANTMINSCSLCGLCTEVCPERFSMAEFCMTARRDMVERGNMPPSAHEFALEDMAFNNGPGFEVARNQPGASQSAYAFFPGCQLAASHPHHVASAYDLLRAHLRGGVGLLMRCCGVPAQWAGRADLFDASLHELRARWKELGSPQVIAACASCLAVFREHAPEFGVRSLWEALAETGLPVLTGERPAGPVAVHDPCSLRHDQPAREAVRNALRTLDIPFEELALSGQFTECCGYGGLMGNVNPALAREVARRRGAETSLDMAASCSMCRDRLAAEGKRVWHALDFVFPGPAMDPAAKGPGFSQRHENRARLKATLLREVWGEDAAPHAHGLDVSYAPGVLDSMEDRRILQEDVEAVLDETLRTGRRMVDRESGRFLASFRPRRMNYWVEYSQDGGQITVTRVWCHRMELAGPTGTASDVPSTQHVYLPEGGDWACACGAELVPGPVVAGYLGSAFTITLLTCADCALELVPEGLALGKMAEVEQLLEDK